jgi:GH18 family chitinase
VADPPPTSEPSPAPRQLRLVGYFPQWNESQNYYMTYDFHGSWDATTNFNAPL